MSKNNQPSAAQSIQHRSVYRDFSKRKVRWQQVSPSLRQQLEIEYFLRPKNSTYAGQFAGLLIFVAGLEMQLGTVMLLGVARIFIDWLRRYWNQSAAACLQRDININAARPAWYAHNFFDGAIWVLSVWPVFWIPFQTASQIILIGTMIAALLVQSIMMFMVPRNLTMFCAGFIAAVLLIVPGAPWKLAAFTTVALILLALLCWELGSINFSVLTSLLQSQRQRSLALSEQVRVNQQLEDARIEATRLALTDVTTGLPNRMAFMQYLQSCIKQQDKGTPFTLFLIDMDYFKSINDSYGHMAGDAALVTMSNVLKQTWLGNTEDKSRNNEYLYIARLGGDEFAALLMGQDQPDALAEVFQQWTVAMAKAMQQQQDGSTLGFSAGAASWPKHGRDSKELLHAADTALRHGKQQQRGQLKLFNFEMAVKMRQSARIFSLLKSAIEREHFKLYLQPQVAMDTGRIIGAEVLVRFTCAELASYDVAQVFEEAEQHGLGVMLSARLLDASLECALCLQKLMAEDIQIAVNLSPSSLKDPGALVERLDYWLACGLNPRSIKLEITENAISGRGLGLVQQTMCQVADKGFYLSLDDFGTGQSAMTLVHSLPVCEVKVAREFIQHVTTSSKDLAIVKATLALCKYLQIRCMIEGVENAEQAEFLQKRGASYAQGFYWSTPLAQQEFINVLKQGVIVPKAPADTV